VRGEDGETGDRAGAQPVRVGHERADRRHRALTVAADAVAEHVAGEHGVAQRGVAPRLLARVVVEAGAAVHQQDPRERHAGRVVPGENAVEGDVTVAVRHVAGGDRHGAASYVP